MTLPLILAFLATASGTLATYLYDEGASFASRVCTGACTGQAALGLIGFVIASFLGLNFLSLTFTVAILALPYLILTSTALKKELRHDLGKSGAAIQGFINHPSLTTVGYLIFYLIVVVIVWQVFERAVIETPEGIYTGVLNNFGDLPFHLNVITGFAYGNNFPPEDPTFAGVRFTYPFISDFISAMYVLCGASLRQSMFIENFILGVCFVGLLHRWALSLLRDQLAAILTPLLVLLNGGLGWVLLWQQAGQNQEGLLGVLKNLPPSFTVIPETTWRWGNAVSALLVPQRGILLGLPLAVIVFTQWWLASENTGKTEKSGKTEEKKRLKIKQGRAPVLKEFPPSPASIFGFHLSGPVKRMIAAGVIAGLLPLVHAHSFVVVMAMGGCIALGLYWRAWLAVGLSLIAIATVLQTRLLSTGVAPPLFVAAATALGIMVWFLLPQPQRSLWYTFFLIAMLIALPQMWWSTHNSAVDSSKFFAWQVGWDRGNENAIWFWLKNTGLFIPLIIAAMVWRGEDYLVPRRLLLFYLPFTLCFFIPNVLKMAPWIWDNIKVLYYWWLASTPLVALLLARLWHQGKLRRAVAAVLFLFVIFSGSLDVAAIALRTTKYQVFDRKGIEFAEIIKQKTEPRSLIVHAPVHNHPVFLTGRASLMGYPGHIWTHGLEFARRESEIRRIYSGAADSVMLMQKYGVEYAVVGPQERTVMSVNEQFFARFPKVGEAGEYRLYKVGPR